MNDNPIEFTFHIRARTVTGQFTVVQILASDMDQALEKFAQRYRYLTFYSFQSRRGRR